MDDKKNASEVLERLFETIASKRGQDIEVSYTAMLFSKGRGKIAAKLGEEAVETVIAALEGGKDKLAAESADLLYHLLVLWADVGLYPAEVWAELARREGKSGHEEKKSRPKE